MFALLLALAAPPSPTFDVHAATGDRRGVLRAMSAAFAVTLAEPDATIDGPALLSVRQSNIPRPAFPTMAGLVLANGDRISGTIVGGDDAALRLRVSSATTWRVPLSSIRVAWFADMPGGTPAFADRYDWLDADRKSDVLQLRNGDLIRGELERLTDTGAVRLKAADGTISTYEPASISALAFNPALTAARRPTGRTVRVTLRGGDRVTLSAAVADAATFQGKTTFGTAFIAPLDQLAALDVVGSKSAYLSDLRPAATVEPFGVVRWDWTADRTVKHRPLAVGADTFDKGVGTHPTTTLSYDLAGKYRTFEAVVGLDPHTGRRGTAAVRVLVDDKPQPVAGLDTLTAAAAVPVRVDVAKAKRLTLVVAPAAGGDVQADVNWADARLVE